MKQHKTAQEYIDDMLLTMRLSYDIAPMPIDLFEYWCNEIEKACHERFKQYIKGQVEDYRLNDEELENALKEANSKLIGETLATLLDKGMIEMSIGEDGEIRYKATEKGKQYGND